MPQFDDPNFVQKNKRKQRFERKAADKAKKGGNKKNSK